MFKIICSKNKDLLKKNFIYQCVSITTGFNRMHVFLKAKTDNCLLISTPVSGSHRISLTNAVVKRVCSILTESGRLQAVFFDLGSEQFTYQKNSLFLVDILEIECDQINIFIGAVFKKS